MSNSTDPAAVARDIETGDKVRFHFDGSFSTHQFQPSSPFETEVSLSLPIPDSETENPTTRIDVQPPAGDQKADTYFFELITPATRIHSSLRSERKRRKTGTNLSGESTASSGLRTSPSHNPVAQSLG